MDFPCDTNLTTTAKSILKGQPMSPSGFVRECHYRFHTQTKAKHRKSSFRSRTELRYVQGECHEYRRQLPTTVSDVPDGPNPKWECSSRISISFGARQLLLQPEQKASKGERGRARGSQFWATPTIVAMSTECKHSGGIAKMGSVKRTAVS